MKLSRRPAVLGVLTHRGRTRRLARTLTEEGERLVTSADLRPFSR